jgi:hypothetical protein
MAIAPPRELKIGKIIDKTFAVLEHIAVPGLIYVVGLTVLNSAAGYFSLGLTAPMQKLEIGLGQIAIGVVFAYLLLDAALRKTGLQSREGGQVLLPYVGLYILMVLGVIFGLILIILPGLIFMARWSIAQPLLVGRGTGVMAAFGESWERTRGNEFPILAAAFAVILPLGATMILASILFDQESVVGIAISQFITSTLSLVSVAMSVALYGMIVGGSAASGGSGTVRGDA